MFCLCSVFLIAAAGCQYQLGNITTNADSNGKLLVGTRCSPLKVVADIKSSAGKNHSTGGPAEESCVSLLVLGNGAPSVRELPSER
jgi:hypothetical protein